jgi:hypothetical protein
MRCLEQEGLAYEPDDVSMTASLFSLFPFAAGTIRRTARIAADRLRTSGKSNCRVDSRLLNFVCREQCDNQLGQLAERLT